MTRRIPLSDAAALLPTSRLAIFSRSLPSVCLLWVLLAAPASAADVKIFRSDDRGDALAAEAEGVSVGEDGEIRLSPKFERLAGLEEPFLFTAAPHPEGGLVVGTGNEGKIFRIDREGLPEKIGATEEIGVYALHVSEAGDVYAAGSPDGSVLRFPAGGGDAETVFEPGATYVWGLTEDSRGRLLVATGLPGQLWRLPANPKAGANAELLYESPDEHVRSVMARADGSLVLGTAGQGLIVELDAGGKARTLYDAAEPEVLAFAAGRDAEGGALLYAALLASEASQVDLSAQNQGGEGEADVAPSGQEATIGSRGGGYEGPRSRVVAIDANGAATSVAELSDETLHGLAVTGGELWLATGQEGRLYRLEGEELVLESTFEERQVVAVVAAGTGADQGLLVATTNGVAVHRHGGERREEGTLTSQVLDAGLAARFGVIRWWGDQPRGSRVSLEVRAGMSSTPDATWSAWSAVPTVAGDGGDSSLEGRVGVGRYVQWRARLDRGQDATGPRLDAVELSYRQLNRAPEISSFRAMASGEILVPQSFNPSNTTFEPWSPNREGIFTSLRTEKKDGQQKALWKRGYRTLRWKAEDDNGDTLRYALEVTKDGDKAQESWLPMAKDLDRTWYSFDATVLPDGVYRFRLTADDRGANPHGEGLEASRRSEPVIIDHTPPKLVEKRRSGGTLEVVVGDEHHPIRDAVYSVDVGEWKAARSVDGLLDGRRETLRLDVPEQARLVLLRLTDAAFNVVTLDLSRD